MFIKIHLCMYVPKVIPGNSYPVEQHIEGSVIFREIIPQSERLKNLTVTCRGEDFFRRQAIMLIF